MKRIILFMLLIVPIVLFSQVLEQKEALSMLTAITAKNYPDANIIYVSTSVTTLNDSALGISIEEEYKKILNEQGKKNNQIYFGFDTDYQTLKVTDIEIIKKDGKIIKLDPKEILQLKDMNMGESSNIYSYSSKLYIGSLPDLEIGDIVYTKAITNINKTSIENAYTDRFGIDNYSKYLYKYSEVSIPSHIKLNIYDINNRGSKYSKKIEEKNGRTTYKFLAKDTPMIIYEPNMEQYNLFAHHLMITSIDSWETISRWYSGLVEPHLGINNDITKKVAELVKTAKTRDEKISRIFYWVARKIRYLGVDKEKNRPGYEPHDVTFTFETRGGVCRDKAALLVAMLREAKISADVILISVGSQLDFEAPAPWFNHAIVMAYGIDGKPEYFLDPTNENTKDFLPAYEEDCSYLIASKKGVKLAIVPVSKPSKNNMSVKIDVNLDKSNTATVKMTYGFKGIFDTFNRGKLVRYTKQNYENYFSKIAATFHPNAELISFTHSDPNDKNRNIEFYLNLKIPNYAGNSKGYTFIPMDATALDMLTLNMYKYYVMSLFNMSERKYDFVMNGSFSFDIEENYHFKDLVKDVSVPQIKPLDYKGFKAKLTSERYKNNLYCKYHFETSEIHFKQQDYLPLKRYLSSLSKNQSLYIIAKTEKE